MTDELGPQNDSTSVRYTGLGSGSTEPSPLDPKLADPAPAPSTSTHPLPRRNANDTQGEEGSTKLTPPRGRPFTSEQAREARQARAEKERQRKLDAENERRLAHLTSRQRMGIALSELTQDDMRNIVRRLAQDAASGDVKSVHALARLLDQSFGRAQEAKEEAGKPVDELQWDEMSPEQRAAYRTALLEQQARERAARQAAGDSTDPRAAGE